MSEPTKIRDLAAEREPNGRFGRGNRISPGRRQGSRNKATVALETILADGAEDVVRAMLKAAKGGDVQAGKVILDRVMPARRGRPVALDLPAVGTAADMLRAQGAVITAMAGGAITPEEAAVIAGVLEAKRSAIETAALEERVAALERRQGGRGP